MKHTRHFGRLWAQFLRTGEWPEDASNHHEDRLTWLDSDIAAHVIERRFDNFGASVSPADIEAVRKIMRERNIKPRVAVENYLKQRDAVHV